MNCWGRCRGQGHWLGRIMVIATNTSAARTIGRERMTPRNIETRFQAVLGAGGSIKGEGYCYPWRNERIGAVRTSPRETPTWWTIATRTKAILRATIANKHNAPTARGKRAPVWKWGVSLILLPVLCTRRGRRATPIAAFRPTFRRKGDAPSTGSRIPPPWKCSRPRRSCE